MTLTERLELCDSRRPLNGADSEPPKEEPKLPEWRRRDLERAKGRRWVAVKDTTGRLS